VIRRLSHSGAGRAVALPPLPLPCRPVRLPRSSDHPVWWGRKVLRDRQGKRVPQGRQVRLVRQVLQVQMAQPEPLALLEPMERQAPKAPLVQLGQQAQMALWGRRVRKAQRAPLALLVRRGPLARLAQHHSAERPSCLSIVWAESWSIKRR
jgi:hypothetical protein